MTLLFKIIGFCTVLLLINNICMGKIESRLRIGKTINVFVRYGYLGISMKVISYNDTERWLFKEPTYNVFRVCIHTDRQSALFQERTLSALLFFCACFEKFKFKFVSCFFSLVSFVIHSSSIIRESINWLNQRRKINRAPFMAISIWNFAIIKSNYFKLTLETLPLSVWNIHGKHLPADGESINSKRFY